MIQKPLDENSRVINEAPPKGVPLKNTYDATISSSTSLTLQTTTTYLEVTAIDKAILLKWGATASTSAFDEVVPANTTRAFIVPTGQTSVQFIEETATAKLVVIEK